MSSRKSQRILRFFKAHKKTVYTVGNRLLTVVSPSKRITAWLPFLRTTATALRTFGLEALIVHPKGKHNKNAIILHLHGGAYISGNLLQNRALLAPICRAAGISALTFRYRLAPAHPYPAQLEDALKAYRYLLEQGYPPEQIFLVGESAGGNLALTLCCELRKQGISLPGCLCLLSPWADLSQSGSSYQTLQLEDATLDAGKLLQAAQQFALDIPLTDPRISPLFADLSGLPPVLVHCGTKELLLSEAELLHEKLLNSGVASQLVRWEGMCHVFQAYGFPESKEANRQIGNYIKQFIC